ncbi:putative diphthamide synthesis protein-domain-containing protein [Gymnopilus junonius]|uniref:2-(3-amino-3-carboxypropyl)histidine synthase subunit 2 n=1 Tax=Gymnopilus junonius TaxID=109634 RepID=A0A9P5NF83_GYMJU|nr:putative diphthamide synthesis protein-domain-containing protein [Gymnopilus junonius]
MHTEFMSIFESNHPPQTHDVAEHSQKKAILLRHDVAFTHAADAIVQRLRQALSKYTPPIPVFYNPIPSVTFPSPSKSTSNPSPTAEHTTIFYIGGESLGLTNLLMTNSLSDVYSYNPFTQNALHESTTGRTNKLLMRRYVAVQKARDADVFGILVGTLGVASYLPLISHIRRLLARKHKKSYTISVGKLNPAKLANFLEIECFVLVACPENSLIEDKEFLRPIVTPYELEVAMQAEQSWTGRYILDFEKLLADAQHEDEQDEASKSKAKAPENGEGQEAEENGAEESDPDQPVFSLVTGKYRHAKRYGDKSSSTPTIENTSSLILRNKDDQLARLSTDSAAGQFLQQRTYQGLELRLGMDAPSVLEQGRSGIARGYQDDRSHDHQDSEG